MAERVVSALPGGGVLTRALRELVRVANEPPQERDDVGVHVRADFGHGGLRTLPQFVGRPGRDRPVLVLARHVRNLRIVACHPSSVPGRVVASH
jgi:hypothetical protein